MGDEESQTIAFNDMEVDETHVLSEFGRHSPADPQMVLGKLVTVLISLGVTIGTLILVSEFTLPGLLTILLPFIALAWAAPYLRGLFFIVDDRSYGLSVIWASTVDGIIMIYLGLVTGYMIGLVGTEVKRHPLSVFTLITLLFLYIFVGFAIVHFMRESIVRIFGKK